MAGLNTFWFCVLYKSSDPICDKVASMRKEWKISLTGITVSLTGITVSLVVTVSLTGITAQILVCCRDYIVAWVVFLFALGI